MREKMRGGEGAPGRAGPGGGSVRLSSVPRRGPVRLWLCGWIAGGWPVTPGSATPVHLYRRGTARHWRPRHAAGTNYVQPPDG